jgi:hypothetical protein
MPIVTATYTFDGYSLINPQFLVERCRELNLSTAVFEGRCNSFFLPRGKDPGRGFLLLTKRDYTEITSSGENATHTLIWKEGNNTVTISNLFIVGYYSILGGQVQHDNDVYMIEVADARCLAHMLPINFNWQLRSPDYTNVFDDTETGDFSDFTAFCNTNLPSGLFTSFTDGGVYPAGNPDGYCFHGVSSWDALFQILDDTDNIGLVTRQGGLKIISASNADTANINLQAVNFGEIIHNSHAKRTDVLLFPEKVRVYFPSRDFAFQTNADDYQVTGTEYWRMQPLTVIDTNTVTVIPDASFKAGTVHHLFDSLPALYDRVGASTNAAACATRAADRVANYLNSLRISDGVTHQIYSGVIDFIPGPRIASVAWMDLGDGIKTEIFLFPRKKYTPDSLSNNKDSIFNSSPLVSCRNFSEHTSSEYPGPPDVSRDHLPFDRWAIIELYEDIPAYGQGLAYVKFSNNSFVFSASAKQITVTDIGGVPMQAGTNGIALFHTQARTWIVSSGLAQQYSLYRFELTETLQLGDEAAAEIVIFNGANYVASGIAITVRDFTDNPGSWSGKAGYQGWCVPAPNDSEVFEIVWMEEVARYIQFELQTEISGGTAFVEITDWWHIKDPDDEAIVVTDREGLWENAPVGAKGLAIWDEKESEYVVVRCEHFARYVSFTLYDDWVAPPDTFLANLDEFWEGLDPADGDGRIQLLDRSSLFPHAYGPDSVRGGGSKGYACYDPEFNVYVPIVCQQMAHMLRCMTAEAFTSGDTEFDVTLATDAVFAIGREQWTKIPIETTLTVKNILAFDGDSGAWCYIVWNFTSAQWELLQIACPA